MNVGDAVVCTPFMTSLHHENSRIPHFGLSLFSPTPAFYKFSVYILLNEIIKVNYPTTIFMQFFLTLLGIYSNPSQQDFPSIPQYNKAKLPINHQAVKLFIFSPCILLCSSFSFFYLPLFIVLSAHTILILTHLLPSSGICYVCLDLEVCSVICLMGLLGHPR